MQTTRSRNAGGSRGHCTALHRTADTADSGLNHEYMAQPGASGGPCGGFLRMSGSKPKNRTTTTNSPVTFLREATRRPCWLTPSTWPRGLPAPTSPDHTRWPHYSPASMLAMRAGTVKVAPPDAHGVATDDKNDPPWVDWPASNPACWRFESSAPRDSRHLATVTIPSPHVAGR